MENEKKILNLCCQYSEGYSDLKSPFKQMNSVYASDGHILIQIPEQIVSGEYEMQETPKCFDLFSKEFDHHSDISLKAIKKKYDVLDDVPNSKECGCCRGIGTVDWEFEYENHTYVMVNSCPVCNGKGYVYDEGTIKDPDCDIKLGICYFSPKYIKILIDIMNLMEVKEVRMSQLYPLYTTMFSFDNGIKLLICSRRHK